MPDRASVAIMAHVQSTDQGFNSGGYDGGVWEGRLCPSLSWGLGLCPPPPKKKIFEILRSYLYIMVYFEFYSYEELGTS